MLLSDLESIWRDNLWNMHNSLSMKTRKKIKGFYDKPVAKPVAEQGFGSHLKGCPKVLTSHCTQLLLKFSGRNLGTLSSALTSSTYVLFKRRFETKGLAKNLGGTFDLSQHGRSYVAFQFLQ